MTTHPSDIVFHLLELQSRDIRVESEKEDVCEVTYESASEEEDEEFQKKRRRASGGKSGPAPRQFTVHLFGAMEDGRPLRCDVMGFRPSFYLRLPEERTGQAVEAIRGYLGRQSIPLHELSFKRVMKHIFYGFTAKRKYPFLEITFPSLFLIRAVRNLFLNDQLEPATKGQLDAPLRGTRVEVFEANLDPMLRFLHTQDLSPCGWVRIRDGVGSITEDRGEDGLVIECDYEDVVPTKGPRVSAPFLTASWDIECFSMTGDFPLAKRTWKKCARELVERYRKGPSSVTAVDLYRLAFQCLSTGTSPAATVPKGMTPVYVEFKRAPSEVEVMLENPKVQAELDGVLESGGGGGGDDADADAETMEEGVEKCLTKTFSSSVRLVGDPVIQIGTTLTRGTAETTERHLFVFPDCAPLDDIVVHAYETEKEMIQAWYEWMVERNPDILLGYNIFGFDESYLWHRAEELGLVNLESSLHGMSRLVELGSEMKLEEKFLSSSAMGDNRMYIWTTHGRLQIDMFHYIKRSITLPSYKLDEVTKHFMSGKLKSYRYEKERGELVLTVSGAVKDVRVGRAITLLDDTGETVSPKMTVVGVEKDTLRVQWEWDNDQWDEMDDATKWVVVKDDVSPQDIFRLHRESAEGRAVVGRYCLQDCDLVIDLYKKLETFNNSMSMANVCTVPVNYIFTRGQGIKIESLIFKFCRAVDILIPVLPVPKGSDDSYEGAIVLDPEPGFYATSPIGVCDFASLYPSTIVSENISHDSLVWVKDFREDGTLIRHQWGSEDFDSHSGYAYTDIEYDIIRPDPNDHRKMPTKVKCGRRICRFAKPLDGTKSTLPQITTWLLQARTAKKKEMKAEKDPERYALLDAEQLAYKLTGNSLYGQLGSGTFKIRLQALAASVTAYGRKQILFAKDAIEQFYGPGAKDPRCAAKCMAKVVYGDSVSGDTPVRVSHLFSGVYDGIPVEELASVEPNGVWRWDEEREKEFYELQHCYSWTETGWTRIHRIIRHRLPEGKKMYRVHVTSGWIDVTGDHSLLDPSGREVKPTELGVGSRLLSTRFPQGDVVQGVEEILDPPVMVYDLTTDNHHFQAGPEGLIVHNTDSLFVQFNVKNPETGELLSGREARQATIDITDEAGHFITKALSPPHDFEFDKAFDPLLMFSKKRYAGNMYEENADDYVHKYMGIALKRRDNAPIVKTIYGGAMKMLLNSRDVVGAFRFVQEKCMELVKGQVSMGQLTVTKSLRDHYADPTRIAHKALADRITERDPGNAPAAGDRIGYVYICPKGGQEASKLQGDRIETPGYIRDHQLVPDYRHYIECQLKNPISQAFALLLEHIPGFDRSMIHTCPSAKENLDRYLLFREQVAAQLLFSDALRYYDKQHMKQSLTTMFGSRMTFTSTRQTVEKTQNVLTITETETSVTTIRTGTASATASATSAATAAATATAAAAQKKKKPILAAAVSSSMKQMTMSNFLLDQAMIQEMNKRKSAAKKQEKEEAKKEEAKKEAKKEEEAKLEEEEKKEEQEAKPRTRKSNKK